MTSGFTLAKHPAMVCAAGASHHAGLHVAETSGPHSRVLLVYDPALEPLGLIDPVVQSIRDAGHTLETFCDLASDPKEQSVDAATDVAHGLKAQCIVGLGGGSALDTSKLVAVTAFEGSPCARYRLAENPMPLRRTGLIAIPTTAGTGSETTGTSIISQADGTKNWFWGPSLKPDMAIMDPQLTVGLPAFWTFFTGMDALVHAIESRTNRYSYDANNPLAERAIVEGIKHLETVVNQPENLAARTGMMVAAAYAGLAIGNTGCAVAHNIGHALGSMASVPHGRAVAIALAATMEWAIEGNRAAFDRVGVLLGGNDAADVAPILRDLGDRCGFPLSLNDQERAVVDGNELAKRMVEPANISMLEATARDAKDGDTIDLATRVLAA